MASTPGGIRRMLPEFRALDMAPLLAAVGGVFVNLQALTVRRVEDAMALLLMSWDNASHFNIFHMQRIHGTVLPLAGQSSDASRWALSDYPQGFHSVMVLLSEMARSTPPDVWKAEVVTFSNFSAIMNILIVVLVISAVCSLPSLRRSPVVGFPIAVFVASGWLFGFGALASMHGFSNFLFTAAMVAAAIVLGQSMTRVLDPIPLFAVGACVSAVMQNWVLLGVFLIPSVLAVLLVTPKGRWKMSPRDILIALLMLVLVTFSAVTAAGQLLTVKADSILYATGGVPPLDFGLLLALLGILGCAGIVLIGRNGGLHDDVRRINWSLSAIWVGVIVAVGMGIAQVVKNGTLSYYMIKFSIALSLLVLLGIALATAGLLGRRQETSDRAPTKNPKKMIAASVVASLGLTQFFGFIFPLQEMGMPASAESGITTARQETSLKEGSMAGGRLLQAVRDSEGLVGPVMYLTTNPGEVDPILAQQWFDSLRASYSEHSWNLSLNMFPLSHGIDSLRPVVLAIREEDPKAQIVVDPENQEALDLVLAEIG
ncbi:hypothetical protein AAGW05_00620 [Arthrobacter sp. LAPM80]|uniref:hypothetical protein n=1 Tax=Arthrobacter sp. LAPM80 TaxID=3141788 RepID=UPI00398A518B